MMDSKESESKNLRFKRVGAARTNEVMERLRILGNCSNRGVYEYSEEEIGKIFTEIEKAVREAKSRFYYTKGRRKFKL